MPLSSESGKAPREVVFRLCIGPWAVLPLRILLHILALGTRLCGEGLGRHRRWGYDSSGYPRLRTAFHGRLLIDFRI